MPNTPVLAAATGLPIPQHVRQAISAEIERLIYLLDLVDGDADLEDGGDHELDADFEEISWSNPLAARLNARGNLIVERVRDRQVRA